MTVELKAQSAKRKTKIKNLKFLVLSFSFTFFALHFAFMGSLAFAQPLSSDELIKGARQYDGGEVTYGGEVIGDIMRRGDYAWVNISDGKNAIGVWAGAPLIKDIIYAGSYRARGDRMEVSGVFHRACAEHGGDLDIHASGIKKIASGGPVTEAPDMGKRNIAVLLLGTLCLGWILTQFKKR